MRNRTYILLLLLATSPITLGCQPSAADKTRTRIDEIVRFYLPEDEFTGSILVAEGDKSPGVLMASGYIAGGAIAGIIIAFLAGVPFMAGFNDSITRFSERNPMFSGESADLWAMLPFGALILLLWLTGREKILASRATD